MWGEALNDSIYHRVRTVNTFPSIGYILLQNTQHLLCLFHLLFVLWLAITQSSASETVGSQPQYDGKANFSEVFQCLSVFEVPSEITHAENIRTQ